MKFDEINTEFIVSSDAKGKDPDSHSPTLKKFHQILWSKKLPSGNIFELQTNPYKYLYHKSDLGEFFLSSDTITHTYTKWKRLSNIIENIPSSENQQFIQKCSTVSSHLIFPSNIINGKQNINAARGTNSKINDRFDLTLECIRRYYLGQDNPLQEVLLRYSDFFKLFENIKGYVDFFLLQDLVSNDYQSVNFYLPFDNFERPAIPINLEEYFFYKNKVLDFINKRTKRIALYNEIKKQ